MSRTIYKCDKCGQIFINEKWSDEINGLVSPCCDSPSYVTLTDETITEEEQKTADALFEENEQRYKAAMATRDLFLRNAGIDLDSLKE